MPISVVANANSRRQRLYESFGVAPAKPSTGMAARGWLARRYELGKRMQSKRSIVRTITEKM